MAAEKKVSPLQDSGTTELVSSSSSSEEDDSSLRVNAAFAKEFEARESKRLGMKELALGLGSDEEEASSDSSESESEDEDGAAATPEVELAVLRTINAIRRRDPRIYDKSARFFPQEEAEEEDDSDDDDDGEKRFHVDDGEPLAVPTRRKKQKKKQTFKDVVREQLLAGADEDESRRRGNEGLLAYDDEQRRLRDAVRLETAIKDEDGLFFTESSSEKKRETELDAELATELETFEALGGSSNDQDRNDASARRREDAFLADFVSRRRWRGVAIEEEDDFDDDVDAMEAFEAKYNFRFEQGGDKASTVATHARDNKGVSSVRAKDERRKLKRDKKKEEEKKEKQRKVDELRRLKNVHLKELRAKLARLRDEAGAPTLFEGDDAGGGGLDDLDADFDPYINNTLWPESAHDAAMAAAFDDAYYDEISEENKVSEEKAMLRQLHKVELEHEADELTTNRNRGTGASFRYRTVAKNDYGLTTAEILDASDAELSKLVSVKRLAPYRDQEFSVTAKRRRKWRVERADRNADRNVDRNADRENNGQKSTHNEQDDDKATSAAGANEEGLDGTNEEEEEVPREKKEKKRRKKKQPVEAAPERNRAAETTKQKKKKKKKTKKVEAGDAAVSEARLKSYGL